MDDLYQDRILDHWEHSPFRGRIEAPDAVADGYSKLCGDALHLELKLDGDRIAMIRFDGDGCIISQASASILAERMEGKSIAEAQRLDGPQVLQELGIPLSPARVKCALLALSVLHQALGEVEQERESNGVA